MNFFNNLIIQNRVKNYFIQSIKNDHLAHAYLFHGPVGSGKTAFAFELAKAVNCESDEHVPCNECPSCKKIIRFNHPDIKYIFPVSKQLSASQLTDMLRQKADNPYIEPAASGHKNIAIEAMRNLKNESKYAPYEAKKRVFIISEAEYFSREAANSFLKLLEEPPADLMLILTSNDLFALLDTIRSRCQLVHFNHFTDQQISDIVSRYREAGNDITTLTRIARNNIQRVFELLDEDSSEKRNAVYSLLKAIAASNFFNISTIIDRIAQPRDKNYLLAILELMLLWFRDSMHYVHTSDTADFINLDFAEAIGNFANAYKFADFDSIIILLDEAYYQIEHNAHPVLTLTNLAININEKLIRAAQLSKEME